MWSFACPCELETHVCPRCGYYTHDPIKKCPRCGTELRIEVHVCPKCGYETYNSLSGRCPYCYTELKTELR